MESGALYGGAGTGAGFDDVYIRLFSQAITSNQKLFEYFFKQKKIDVAFSQNHLDIFRLIDSGLLRSFETVEQYNKSLYALYYIVNLVNKNAFVRELFARTSHLKDKIIRIVRLIEDGTLNLKGDDVYDSRRIMPLITTHEELIAQSDFLSRRVKKDGEEHDIEKAISHYMARIEDDFGYHVITSLDEHPQDFLNFLEDLSGATKPDAEIVYEFEGEEIVNKSVVIYNLDNLHRYYDYELKRFRSITLGQISDAISYESFLPGRMHMTHEEVARTAVARYGFGEERSEEILRKILSPSPKTLLSLPPFTIGLNCHKKFCAIISGYCNTPADDKEPSIEERSRKNLLQKTFTYAFVGRLSFYNKVILEFLEGRTIKVSAALVEGAFGEEFIHPAEILKSSIASINCPGIEFILSNTRSDIVNIFIRDQALAEREGFKAFKDWIANKKVEFLLDKKIFEDRLSKTSRVLRSDEELNSALIQLRRFFPKTGRSIPIKYQEIRGQSINLNIDSKLADALAAEDFGRAVKFIGNKLNLTKDLDIFDGVKKLETFLDAYKTSAKEAVSLDLGIFEVKEKKEEHKSKAKVEPKKPKPSSALEESKKQEERLAAIQAQKEREAYEKRQEIIAKSEAKRLRKAAIEEQKRIEEEARKIEQERLVAIQKQAKKEERHQKKMQKKLHKKENESAKKIQRVFGKYAFRKHLDQRIKVKQEVKKEAIKYHFNQAIKSYIDSVVADKLRLPSFDHQAPILSNFLLAFADGRFSRGGEIDSESCANIFFHGSILYSKNPKDLDVEVVFADKFFEKKSAIQIVEEIKKIDPAIAHLIEVKGCDNLRNPGSVSLKIGDFCDLTIKKQSIRNAESSWTSSIDSACWNVLTGDFEYKPSYTRKLSNHTVTGFESPFLVNHAAKDLYLRLVYSTLPYDFSRANLAWDVSKAAIQSIKNSILSNGLEEGIKLLDEKVEKFIINHKISDPEEVALFRGNLGFLKSKALEEIRVLSASPKPSSITSLAQTLISKT